LFLPPYDDCDFQFLRDITEGKRSVLTNEQVRQVHVPRVAEFKVKGLLEMARKDELVSKYLPDVSEKRVMNRQFLFTVINTLRPSYFPTEIHGALHHRKEKKALLESKYISMSPAMYQLIMNSQHVATSTRGRALALLNTTCKKRKKRPANTSEFGPPTKRVKLSSSYDGGDVAN
jgi:hypothetical protein